jgi:hypothetical protein
MYLMRPAIRGVYRMESLLDGTLDLEYVLVANDALNVTDENEYRLHEWQERNRDR